MNKISEKVITGVNSKFNRSKYPITKSIKFSSNLKKYLSNLNYKLMNQKGFDDLYEHEKMLSDKPRVDSYYKAISERIKPGDQVVDLGTGTGILSFFASKSGADKIYAIDHSNIISIAKELAEFNGISNIEFIQSHSREFKAEMPLDIILHEQMGDILFDEHMVENICDLRDRLLSPDGMIIPSQFEFFIEPVKIRDSRHIEFISEMKIHDIDFSVLKNRVIGDISYRVIASNGPSIVEEFLCEPEPLMKVDLHTIKPGDMPKRLTLKREVNKNSRLDAFIVYFSCIFDKENVITTGPWENRATNWGFRLLRAKSQNYNKGDIIRFQLDAEDLKDINTWKWN